LSSTVRTGRISYVTDADWYRLSLSNGGSASVLHYRVQTTTNGGRFSPLNGPSDRQIRVFTPFGGGAGPCADTANPACPKDLNSPVLATATVFCQQALCTRSMREEDFDYANIRNFEGKIPIPAGGGTYYFVVQDDGTNWADDLDYTVTLTQSSDADEQTRAGLPSQTQTASMGAVDGTNFPAPAPGGAVVSGTLSHGHGRLLNNDPTEGQGVRASRDYDAENDRDRYELTFPGLSAPADRAWALQWDVTEVSGALPGDLLVSLEFCEGVNPACTIVDRTSAGDALGIAYQSGDLVSWHNTFGGAQPIWSQTDLGATQRFQALPAGCFCLERRFGQSGRFFVTVSALDRDTHDTISYTLRSSLAPYPQAYPNPDGGTALSCPAPQDLGGGTYDGGCGFAE
ncbi:MAG: hypothetical protein ACKVPX_10465, partial [Myxococcaceae bacterium]